MPASDTDSAATRIAIVGGGLSGLTTAYYLRRCLPTADVRVFEAGDRVGGVIHSEHVENEHGKFVLDHGADMFATEPPAALDLCRDLGVADRLLTPRAEDAGALIVCRGKLEAIPAGFVLARATKLAPMLTTPVLSPAGKLRFLGERFVPPAEDKTDQSVADFVRQRMGEELLDRLAGPLIAGIYTADVEQLSLEATLGPLAKMVRTHGSLAKATAHRKRHSQDDAERGSAGARYAKFRGFPGGMREFIDLIADGVGRDRIAVSRPVTAMTWLAGEACWRLSFGDSAEDFHHVILAIPPKPAVKLLATAGSDKGAGPLAADLASLSESLGQIPSASTAIVVMAIEKSKIARLPRQFGFVVPAIEERNILAASFASHKYANRCPENHTIVRVFVGGMLQPELLESTDEELIELVKTELEDLIGLDGEPTIATVVRWNDAMPQYHVGHLDLEKQIRQSIGRLPGLSLVTNAIGGVGIAPVIGSAKRTATKIAAGVDSEDG